MNYKKNPLKAIETLVKTLPEKDAKLSIKFLKERNFQGILELVESDIYKLQKEDSEDSEKKEEQWIVLRDVLCYYMSFLDIPDDDEDYYDY